MSNTEEGRLRTNANGRWEIWWPDRPYREAVELTSGDVFRVEVAGREGLHPTRMESAANYGPTKTYYSVNGYPLFEGARAALKEGE